MDIAGDTFRFLGQPSAGQIRMVDDKDGTIYIATLQKAAPEVYYEERANVARVLGGSGSVKLQPAEASDTVS